VGVVRKEIIPPLPSFPLTLCSALAGIGCLACGAPTAVVPVAIVAVGWLWAILAALIDVTRATEQLALQGFLDE
jgi:hypothetical protein